MKSNIGVILGLVMVVFAVMLGVSYATTSFGALDLSTNISGSEFEEQYNGTVESIGGTLNILQVLPMVAAVIAILAALIGMKTYFYK